MATEGPLLNTITNFGSIEPQTLQPAEFTPIKQVNPVEAIASAKKSALALKADAKKGVVKANPKTSDVQYTLEDLMRQQVAFNEGTEEGMNSFVADASWMAPNELAKIYGPNTPMLQRMAVTAANQLSAQNQLTKDYNTSLGDTIRSVAKGAGSMAEGAAATGRLITDSMGLRDTGADLLPRIIENAGGYLADTAESNMSGHSRVIGELVAREKDVRAVESKRIADEALASGEQGPWESALKRVVRDTGSGIEAFADHPAAFSQTVAESLPSIAASAGGGRMVGEAIVRQGLKSRGIAAEVIERFLASDKGRKAVMAASTVSQPAISGALEGSGAVGEAQEIFENLTTEQIENAPDYANLREEGNTHEEAADIIRQRVSRDMGLKQAASGFLTGFASRRFDAAPASGGVKSLIPNAFSETVEEGIQGGTGGLGKNLAMQKHIDPETDILAGVGEQIGEGMAAGLGMVGTIQGPGAAADATAKAGKAAAKGVVAGAKAGASAAKDALNRRTEAQLAADSSVTETALATEEEAAMASLEEAEIASGVGSQDPTAAGVTETAGEVPAADPEATEAAPTEVPTETPTEASTETPPAAETPEPTPEQKVVQKMRQAVSVKYEDIPERVRGLVTAEDGSVPAERTNLIRTLNTKFVESTSEEEKLHIAAAMAQQFKEFSPMVDQESMATITEMTEDNPVKQSHTQLNSFMQGFAASPTTAPIRTYLQENMEQVSNVISGLNENTDEATVTETLTSAATVHEQAPDQADPEVLSQALDMARKRNIKLPDDIVKTLESTIDISRVAKLHAETYESSPIIDPKTQSREDLKSTDVRQQIFTKGWRQKADSTGSPKGSKRRSAVDYVTDVRAAVQTGNLDAAKKIMGNLNNFMVTIQNKLGAMDKSSKDGNRHGYEFYDPDTNKWYMSDEVGREQDVKRYGAPEYGVIHKARNPQRVRNSYNLYRQIFADATAITAIQQSLAAEFPQLGIEPSKFTPASISISRNQGIFELKQLGELGEAVLAKRHARGAKGATPPASTPPASTTSSSSTEGTPPSGKPPSQTPPASTPPAGTDENQDQSGEEETTPEETNNRDLKEHFKDQVEDEFHSYFENDKNSHSLVRDAASPSEAVNELLGEVEPSSGQGLVKQKLLSEVPKLVKRMNERMTKRMGSKNLIKDRKTGKVTKRTSEEKRQWKNLRHAIFAKVDDKGNATLSQQVAETVAIAALATVMDIAPKHRINMADAMEKQGFENWEGEGGKNLERFLKEYESNFQVRDRIGRMTMRMMGIKPHQEALESSSIGAIDTLVTETLQNMIEEGIIEYRAVDVFKKGVKSPITISGFKLGDKFTEAERKMMNKHSDLIQETVMPGDEPKFYLGEAPKDANLSRRVKGTQNALSRKQQQAVRNSSNIANYWNKDFSDFVDKIGEENMAKMRGYIEITEEMEHTYNVNDLASIEGRNQTIMAEIAEVSELKERLTGTKDGFNTPIFFPHEVTKVGRVQSVGPASGQNNKFARAMVRATWAVLNLADNADHQEGFWRSVLQMSGTRISTPQGSKKIERLSTEQIMGTNEDGITNAEAAIRAKYAPVINELYKMVSGSGEMNIDLIMEKMPPRTEPVVMEALMAVAKYDLAKEEGTLGEFTHSVPLEADGVTNGPAAVLVKFATGNFTKEEIEQYERLGYFFTHTKDSEGNLIPRTLDTQSVPLDTYEVNKDVATVKIAERQKQMAGDRGQKAINDAMSRFLMAFNPLGVALEEQILEEAAESLFRWKLDRNASKNPLTKTTYGAGQMGTARGILNEALTNFYRSMSEYNQERGGQTLNEAVGYSKSGDVMADLQLLTSSYYHTSASEGTIGKRKTSNGKIMGVKFNPMTKKRSVSLTKIGLDNDAFESMAENLNTVYVEPLYKAVEETMGSSFSNMQKVIKAASLQSTVLQALHRRMMKEFGPNEVPSPAFQKEWIERFKRLGALYETQDQVFSIGGMQDRYIYGEPDATGLRRPKDISRSVNEELSIGFRGLVPGAAGVGAAAYINIGTGDGFMMTQAMATLASAIPGMDRVLQIYDGMEMPADAIKEIGKHMNQSAFAAWQSDTMKGVQDSFHNFVREFNKSVAAPDGVIDQEMILDMYNDMAESYADKKTEYDSSMPEEISNKLVFMSNELAGIAENTALRAKARSKFASSIDQMAGAGAPYMTKGPLAGEDHAAVAQAINEEMARLEGEKKDKADHRLRSNAALSEEMRRRGDALRGNVRGLWSGDLGPLMKHMDRQSRDLYDKIIKPAISNTTEIIYGPREELEAYRAAAYNKDTLIGVRPIPENGGQYDPHNDVVYIVEPTNPEHLGEAVMHELTHAVLAHKIYQYFKDSTAMPKEHRDAMERIVSLSQEFLGLNFRADNPLVQERIEALRSKMDTNGVNAVTVNELVAEILTNPELREAASQQKVSNPAIRITRGIIKAIRQLFPNFAKTFVNESYFDNMLFNVEIMVTTPITPVPYGRDSLDWAGSNLNMARQETGAGNTGSRAARTSKMVQESMAQVFNQMGVGPNPELTQAGADLLMDRSVIALMDMQTGTFEFNTTEEAAFRQVMNLFMGDARINGAVLTRAREVYDHVMDRLTYADFMAEGVIPGGQEEADARAKYDALTGVNTRISTDANKRDIGLPVFLALAASNEEFSKVLSKFDLPRKARATFDGATSLDDWLSRNTQAALDQMTALVVGEDKQGNAAKAAKNLAERLTNLEATKASAIENIYQNTLSLVDDTVSGFLDKHSTEYTNKLRELNKGITNNYVNVPVKVAQSALSAFSKKEGYKTAEEFTRIANTIPEVFTPLTELMAELRGRTPDNAKIYDMVNKVKHAISSIREVFRDNYDKIISEKFTRKLSKAEWKAMQIGIGQIDTAVLVASMGMQGISRMFRHKGSRDSEITKLSQGLTGDQLSMAERLATFMVDRTNQNTNGPGLRSNAFAIMAMTATRVPKGLYDGELLFPEGWEAQVEQIDKLVTIMAIGKLPEETRKTMVDLLTNESTGMNFSLAQMDFFRRQEQLKTKDNLVVLLNQWKGYIPNESGAGVDVIIDTKDDATHRHLAFLGYEKVEDYKSSPTDPQHGNLVVYRSTVSGKNPYTQGVAQTVQNSQNGVDTRTGRDVSGLTSGIIRGEEAGLVSSAGSLRPVLNEAGDIVAYERLLSQSALDQKKPKNHFGKMIGAMAGRQIEEAKAKQFNTELVKSVHEQYKADVKRNLKHEYIDIAQSKDPIHKDTWNTAIPRDMKDELRKYFGSQSFPVRKDMIPMVVGYRNAGVSDFWTGTSRLPKEVQEGIRTLVTQMLGRKAYAYLKNAETILTSTVAEAKHIIVVKSMIVPAMNIASNVAQLISRGVSLRFILTEGINKFHEINSYLASREKEMRLNADLRATTDPIVTRKLKAQLETIKATNKRLSIWPLIEAGEFQSISEGLNEVNASLKEGKFGEWVEQQVENLPEGVKTLGRYAVVSKATSLYKGLNRSVQYGDFLAKAIMYDDLSNRRGLNQAEAFGKITQEFVNYNVAPGRLRTMLETFGLTWFMTYKLRSLKPAIEAIQENPLRALMMNMTLGQSSIIGTAVEDNIASVIVEGRLDNSVGLGMMFRAPSLMPWGNIAGI